MNEHDQVAFLAWDVTIGMLRNRTSNYVFNWDRMLDAKVLPARFRKPLNLLCFSNVSPVAGMQNFRPFMNFPGIPCVLLS